MRVAGESGIVETINGNTSEENPVAKMEDLLVEDGNVTLTIRLIMQGKVSAYMPNCDVCREWSGENFDRVEAMKESPVDVLIVIAYYCYELVSLVESSSYNQR